MSTCYHRHRPHHRDHRYHWNNRHHLLILIIIITTNIITTIIITTIIITVTIIDPFRKATLQTCWSNISLSVNVSRHKCAIYPYAHLYLHITIRAGHSRGQLPCPGPQTECGAKSQAQVLGSGFKDPPEVSSAEGFVLSRGPMDEGPRSSRPRYV